MNLAQFLIDVLLDHLKLFVPRFALAPILQSHEKKCVVTGAHKTEQAKAHDAGGVFHSRRLTQDRLDFPRDLVCALERSCIG